MNNLVSLEDSVVLSLLRDADAIKELPCLAGPSQLLNTVSHKNCKKCKREKARITQEALRVARNCIRTSRGQGLQSVKRRLDTRQIRVIDTNSKGKRVQYTL